MNEAYYGHESQLFGVEEVRLIGGRGDGMRMFQVRNGKGLEFSVNADRCADLTRLSFKGDNFSYISAGGYAAPAYYDGKGSGWLKTFTCGMLTTCGLDAVGTDCVDEGEALGLHGPIGQQPADRIYWDQDEEKIWIKARINYGVIFGRKLTLDRTITVSKSENVLTIDDTVTNHAEVTSPMMILYHMNVGYPLLSEESELHIPSSKIVPRNDHAAEDLATWDKILPPTACFEEQCYYHTFDGPVGSAAIYNPAISKGLKISFGTDTLDWFVQWKNTGYKDYVMGLEPGNCSPEGRDVDRKQGSLKFLEPGKSTSFHVELRMIDGPAEWEDLKK